MRPLLKEKVVFVVVQHRRREPAARVDGLEPRQVQHPRIHIRGIPQLQPASRRRGVARNVVHPGAVVELDHGRLHAAAGKLALDILTESLRGRAALPGAGMSVSLERAAEQVESGHVVSLRPGPRPFVVREVVEWSDDEAGRRSGFSPLGDLRQAPVQRLQRWR